MQCFKDGTASLAAYELRVLNCFGITFQFQNKYSFTILRAIATAAINDTMRNDIRDWWKGNSLVPYYYISE